MRANHVTSLVIVSLTACGARTPFEDWATVDAGAVGASVDAAASADAHAADAKVPNARDVITLKWGPCSRAYSRADECATFQAPLIGDDKSRPVTVHVAHVKAKKVGSNDAPPQVWLLQGGPGGSAVDMVDLAKQYMQDALPTAEYYAVDHRGTGLSSGLSCAASNASDCVAQLAGKWGNGGLSGFSTTEAARDVDQLIASTRAPGQKVFVYGVSYGTYWAHRLVQLTKQSIDGIILDSFAIPTSTFADTNKFYDDVFKTLVEACVKFDTNCASKLGTNPWQFVQTTMKAHKSGALCKSAGLSHTGLKNGIAAFMQYEELHGLLPSMIYRLSRCNAEDQRVLANLDVGERTSTSFDSDEQFSTPLYYNVVMGELWPTPTPTQTALASLADSMTIATSGLAEFPLVAASWPRYPNDEYVGKWYTGTVPVLTLNSALDVQTPAAEARETATRLGAPGQTYVEFPYNNHGVILEDTGCATTLIGAFMTSPSSKLDTTCIQKAKPPRFTDDAMMKSYFNANSTWLLNAPAPRDDELPRKWKFRFHRPNVPIVK